MLCLKCKYICNWNIKKKDKFRIYSRNQKQTGKCRNYAISMKPFDFSHNSLWRISIQNIFLYLNSPRLGRLQFYSGYCKFSMSGTFIPSGKKHVRIQNLISKSKKVWFFIQKFLLESKVKTIKIFLNIFDSVIKPVILSSCEA